MKFERSIFHHSLFLMVGGVWLSTAGAAQSGAAETDSTDEVVVYGKGYRTTGTKSDLLPLQAPMSFEIYDSKLLQERQADTVNEALRYVPGITPESRATVTIFDQYTIRGFESYRNYYDGLPLQTNGLWNLTPQVDTFATESIEVLKGPTSVLYGSAPPGGMVNQTAKQPRGEAETLLRLRVGSNELYEVGVDSTGPLAAGLNYRVIALKRERDAQQRTTEEERFTFAPSVTWNISDRTTLNLNAYYQDDPELTPSTPLPAVGTLYRAPYGWLDADAYAGDEGWAGAAREVTMVGYKLDHDVNGSISLLQNFRYTDGTLKQKNTYNLGLRTDGRTLDRAAYFTDEAQHGFVVDNQLAWHFGAGATTHRLLFGAEYQQLDSSVQYGDTIGAGTPGIDLGNPDFQVLVPAALPFGTYTEDHDIEQRQLGLYLQDEIKWGGFIAIAGLRWDDYESSDRSVTPYGAGTTRIDQDEISGRAALIYAFDNGLSPYINYSESFEPTSGTDSLTGKAFEPTTAKQSELGIKYRHSASGLTATVAYYDLRKQNVVVNTPTFSQKTQTGEVRSEGVELNVTAPVTERLLLTFGYNYQDVEVTKNPLDPALKGNHPVWVADQQASLWASYALTPALSLSGGARYIGESAMDAANSDTVPAYTLVDMAASYEFGGRYRLGLSVSNLLDETYVGACYDASNCWMGIERSVELTVDARL